MEDVSEYFKSSFLNLHKNTFGKNYQQKTLKERVTNFNDKRRETRDTLIFKKRKIDVNMTPINTPEPRVNIKHRTNKKDEKVPNQRLDMLHKWKVEKEKQKQEEKKNRKPLFKVCRVPSEVGLPNLEKVNKATKGKPIQAKLSMSQSQFAPPNHKFNAPKNVKPIAINSVNCRPAKLRMDLYEIKVSANSDTGNSSKPSYSKNSVSQQNTRPVTRLYLQNKDTKNDGKIGEKKEYQASNSFTQKGSLNRKVNRNFTCRTIQLSSSEYKNKTPISKNTLITKKLNHNSENKNEKLVSNKKILKKSYSGCNAGDTKILVNDNSKVLDSKFEKDLPTLKNSQSIVKSVDCNQSEVKANNFTDAELHTPKSIHKSHKKASRKSNNKLHMLNKEQENDKNKNDSPVTTSEGESSRLKLQLEECERKNYNTKSRNSVVESAAESMSPDYPIDNSIEENPSTPLKINKEDDSPVYVSPFVTVSRGKTRARKEYKIRHYVSSRIPDFEKSSSSSMSPKAGAEYFLKKLNNEIRRIEGICDIWNNYKNSNEIPEEGIDLIDVALGQSKLLISKKFQQFRNLIEQCRKSNFVEKPITCEDLHGFWDMIYIQVLDLDKRFNNLDYLKENNWQEVIPEKEKPVKRGKRKIVKRSSNSTLKNLIKAARNVKKSTSETETCLFPQTDETKIFSGGYYSITSPVRDINESTSTGSIKRSLRVSLLTNQTKNRISPPLMEMSRTINWDALTASKSILKNHTKSAKRITKSVLFKDDLEENILPNLATDSRTDFGNIKDKHKVNKENDQNDSNLILFSPVIALRRSKRLSKTN